MDNKKIAKELVKIAKELTGGEDKKAEWSKRFKQLTYWTSRNTSTSIHCDSKIKAKKIIDLADVKQELIVV